MPTVLRRSGPDIRQPDGSFKTPRALVHFCETCGFEGAAFGTREGHRLLSYCGWQNGAPACVGKAKNEAA